ncbi:MAG: DUF58 domain-containing protein [Thiotrichaceae bacterium]|nr:DUF58 domain-containing protein [Thiotrichaceae bacterium]
MKSLFQNAQQLLTRLFHTESAISSASTSNTRSSGTHVTLDHLIRLQRYARTLDLSRRISTALHNGASTSQFRGRGMDYQESRVYQAGDDVRNMDWRVTARAGRPHVKVFEEERERPVVLLVDYSSSLFFGSVNAFKSVVATEVAALLAWASVNKSDRIGALLVNSGHKELPPKMGKRAVLQLLRELIHFSDPNKVSTNASTKKTSYLNEELQRLRRIARPGSMVFLISDFYRIDDETQRHLMRLKQHCDVVAIQVTDPLEESPPPAGRYHVTDGKTDAILDTRKNKSQQQYQSYFAKHHQHLQNLMSQQRILLLKVSTADDVSVTMQGFFAKTKKVLDKVSA